MSHERKVLTETSPTYPERYENSWVGDDLKGLYIHDAKRHPVLPKEEIARLSQLVQEGIAATARLDDLSSVLTVDELESLERAQKLGHDARNDIVSANTGLVFKWAAHYEKDNIDFLDLVQAGNLGLIRAAEKFEPEKGFAFSTYATKWIVSFMSTEVHETRRTISVPAYQSAQLQKLHRIISDHFSVNGEGMTLEQMAAAMNKTEEQITEMLGWEYKMEDLYKDSSGESGELKLIDGLIDHDTPKVEDIALDNAAEHAIIKAVHGLLAASTLDERSKEIVRMQFGIGYDKAMSGREIEKEVSGSWTTIKKLSEKAMEQLKAEAELFDMAGLLD